MTNKKKADKDTERGSQLQSAKMEVAQGNEKDKKKKEDN